MNGDFHVRPAKESDLERAITIHAAAFPDARDRDARRRNFVENARGDLSELRVIERDGALVGHAFVFPTSTHLGGERVDVGAVASVGIAPEARGTGAARALMNAVHAELRGRGTPLALLYPFRHAFYAELGYGTVELVARLRIAPRELPRFEGAVRAGMRADADAIQRCYERCARAMPGAIARRGELWRALLGREGRQVFVAPRADGELAGYVLFDYLAPDEVQVAELVAEDVAARRALLGLLARLRDQVEVLHLIVDRADPLHALLVEPRARGAESIREYIAVPGELGAGAMLRIIDLERALLARGYADDASFVVELEDERAAVQITQGRAVRAARASATVRTDRSTFALLYAGTLRVADAVAYGRASVDTAKTAELLDACLSSPPFRLLEVF